MFNLLNLSFVSIRISYILSKIDNSIVQFLFEIDLRLNLIYLENIANSSPGDRSYLMSGGCYGKSENECTG